MEGNFSVKHREIKVEVGSLERETAFEILIFELDLEF